MIEDKEYPVKVTNEMIMQYKNMVYQVYYRHYYPRFAYFQKDLVQCGLWGVFLAHQRYELRFSKYIKPLYFYMTIHNKMQQYLDHEKHHILQDYDEPYDWENFEDDNTKNPIFKADLERIYTKLTKTDKLILHKWLHGYELSKMGFKTRQATHARLKKIKNIIKEYYNES